MAPLTGLGCNFGDAIERMVLIHAAFLSSIVQLAD
jgi:hypothetical protein